MIQLASLVIFTLDVAASSWLCTNPQNVPCPGPQGASGGCLPPSSVCDGTETCREGEDEEEEFCRSWNCSPGMVKCPDNRQCIPERLACGKAVWRYHRLDSQYNAPCRSGGATSSLMCSR